MTFSKWRFKATGRVTFDHYEDGMLTGPDGTPQTHHALNNKTSAQMILAQTPAKSHTARNVAVIVIVVAVALIGFYIIRGGSTLLTGVAYPNVTVSGSVKTVGAGTSPFRVDFTSNSGQNYTASVQSNAYQITLPNGHTYSTTVHWSFGGITGGTCNGGTLNLNVNSNAMTFNITC